MAMAWGNGNGNGTCEWKWVCRKQCHAKKLAIPRQWHCHTSTNAARWQHHAMATPRANNAVPWQRHATPTP
eukprot:4936084-Lingulodinium_polyedra.AAC.1